MRQLLPSLLNDLLHLFYPHTCAGCGSDLLEQHQHICFLCHYQLPLTGFEKNAGNPVEQLFYGLLPVQAASATYYFNKQTSLQQLIHALKYKNRPEVGLQLGRWMGQQLQQSNRFTTVQALVPMPLFIHRQQQRGYNQAERLCAGMAEVLQLPVLEDAVIRSKATSTQTRKNRVERRENVADSFLIAKPEALQGKHLLLVDDVVTTGATLEACGSALLQGAAVQLSVATLAWATKD